MKCPVCDGVGVWKEHIGGSTYISEKCSCCGGTGYVPFWKWLSINFWEHAPVWFVEAYGDLRYKIYYWINRDDSEDS
jgi:hypothetical protein